MSAPIQEAKCVLAIDPTSKGFGFAVLEGPEKLIDWGVKHAGTGAPRNRKSVAQACELMARYRPEVLVVEHTSAKGCHRRARVRRLIKSLLTLARRHRLRARRISRRSVLRSFGPSSAANKYRVAVTLTERFPELALHLPPERKLGDSEDERMAIFDALSFGWMFYETMRREARALSLLGEQAPFPHD
jgi:hypothetical protein